MLVSPAGYLQDLNEQQRFAVSHSEGPMLILAGAGSGKTRTITCKIAFLIDQKICQTEQILAVTFTNKAAKEMRSRVEGLLPQFLTTPLVCTFHSFATRLLRRHAHLLDYRRDFTICDREDQRKILRTVYQQLGLSEVELPIRKTQALISRAKNRKWGPEKYRQLARDEDTEVISNIFSAYENYLKRSKAVDFDGLILLTVRLLEELPQIREHYAQLYRYLLIDEYQDTNPPQYDMVRSLASVHQNISAVGDEDQSIYGFRGADIGNILRFESDFPGAVVVKLEENYRSTQTILNAAASMIGHNRGRKGKTLWTKNSAGELIELYEAQNAAEEALYVTYRIHQHVQEGEEGIAVLYRTNFQSRQFEEALNRLGITYKLLGSLSFYHRREIKDALAFLRVARNPDDNVSLLRIINEPPRGIGRVTLDHLQKSMRESSSSLWSTLTQSLYQGILPTRSQRALESFTESVKKWQSLLQKPLPSALKKILESSGYLAALQAEGTEEANQRALNLKELLALAQDYAQRLQPLQEFLDHAALHSEADEYDESAPVTLMTLHNAKGLEFPIVFLVGCEEGLFPHSRSLSQDDLEEERRLCYVGITRAQRRLYLTYSQRRRFFGSEIGKLNQPSRFLAEIPQHLIQPRFPLESRSVNSLSSSGLLKQTPFGKPLVNPLGRPGKDHGYPLSSTGIRKTKRVRDTLVSGASVFHEKYGQGQVLEVQDTGNDLKVTVRFPGMGIKKMLQRYARLRLI